MGGMAFVSDFRGGQIYGIVVAWYGRTTVGFEISIAGNTNGHTRITTTVPFLRNVVTSSGVAPRADH